MSDAVGWVCTVIAVCFFGTYAVPTKFVPTGDGWVFQWVECAGILLVGLITEFIAGANGSLYLEPAGLLGGMFWCLGNTTVVPVVDTIGLGMGMLIWGGTSMVVGWSGSFFGWRFGDLEIVKQKPFHEDSHKILNVVGVVIALCSIVAFLPIKPTITKKSNSNEEKTPLLHYEEVSHEKVNEVSPQAEKSGAAKKILGVFLSVLAGVLYGVNLAPVTYLQERPYATKPHPLSFCLSHFAGIFFTSTAILIVYCIYKKNRPQFYPESILPAFVAGIGWGIAQSAWFVANSILSPVITFPIISTTPGLISAFWGVIVFKEIQGKRNFFFLTAALLLTFAGIAFIAVSKKGED
ncbi:transmembrane protein [Planoprotostelium fungivorum]|uniref:Transmembrane protein n=1 Tax=Planoprotostelium fungivorum TaxID=1890364 RepID=A0A2P6NEA8_9EUKA|nr:transmembrane protein [Planoprotostelium fungivorum]